MIELLIEFGKFISIKLDGNSNPTINRLCMLLCIKQIKYYVMHSTSVLVHAFVNCYI